MTPGIVIAGTHSGCGKSTVTLGLLAAFTQAGERVAPFKVGPDYIDPGLHRHITGSESINIDGWMMGRAWSRQAYDRYSEGASLAIIEGVMGLFDGFSGTGESGSTAQMAKWLNLPVILVVSAASMARSAAAIVKGFTEFDPDLDVCGVIFNHVGSSQHGEMLKSALESATDLPCLGILPRTPAISVMERHLGLVTADDGALNDEKIKNLSALITGNLDMDRIRAAARVPTGLSLVPEGGNISRTQVRIAVARDEAFSFYYTENFRLLREAGAELLYFSPLSDTQLPEGISGIYLGGGYPELHAESLSSNTTMRTAISDASASGMPVYGECGGLVYLSRFLTDFEDRSFPMAGCFPFDIKMHRRRAALGYREITTQTASFFGPPGTRIRGHEFHYSAIVPLDEDVCLPETVYSVTDRSGCRDTAEGFRTYNTIGSYVHLHFGSCPRAAAAFVNACAGYQTREQK